MFLTVFPYMCGYACVRYYACLSVCVCACMCAYVHALQHQQCSGQVLVWWLNAQRYPVTITKHEALLTLLQLYNGDLAIPGK